MYFQILKNLLKIKGWRPAKLAYRAGISRAAVSRWYRKGEKDGVVNVETRTLVRVAAALRLSAAVFLQKRALLAPHRTRFLWDGLYPDMEGFLKALAEDRLVAVARLVQVLGFAEARKTMGKKIVTGFACYKKFIKPARRRQLEVVWPLYNSQD